MKKVAWMLGAMVLSHAGYLLAGIETAVPEMPPGFAPYAIAGMFGLLMVVRRFFKK